MATCDAGILGWVGGRDDVLRSLTAWAEEGRESAIATLIAVRGSAPLPVGSKLALSNGVIAGAVSGGCVEAEVVEAAEAVLAGRGPRLLRFRTSRDEHGAAALPCGGEIDVFVDRFEPALALDFTWSSTSGGRAALITVVEGPGAVAGAKMIITDDGTQSGSLGDETLDRAATTGARERMSSGVAGLTEAAGVQIFVDVVQPAPRLVIFGTGAHAMALCRLTHAAGWRPIVADPRARFATEERFPDAETIVHAWPADAVRAIGGLDGDTCVVVLTHDPKLDDAALEIALASDACYVGAMGSRRMHAARRERLLARGVTDGHLSRLSAPIGLDLGGSAPAEVALAILAEAVAARRGGSALPLAVREASG